MEGQVLVLCALKVFLECHIDRLNTEEWKWVEDSQMILCNDFHVSCILCVTKYLQDFLDFLVREDVELIVLDQLVVYDSFDFSGQRQAGQLRW